MTASDRSRTAVLEFLRSRPAEARFASEVAASLRDPGIGMEDVEALLRALHAQGEVYLEEFVPPDPHFPKMLVVSAVDTHLPAREALEAARLTVHRAFDSWLREVLATHRCIG